MSWFFFRGKVANIKRDELNHNDSITWGSFLCTYYFIKLFSLTLCGKSLFEALTGYVQSSHFLKRPQNFDKISELIWNFRETGLISEKNHITSNLFWLTYWDMWAKVKKFLRLSPPSVNVNELEYLVKLLRKPEMYISTLAIGWDKV